MSGRRKSPWPRRAPERDAGSGEHVDDAMDWLLNRANLPAEVIDHFWHIADGHRCQCVSLGRVQPRDER